MPTRSLVHSVIYSRSFLVDLLSAEPSSRHGVLEGYSSRGMTRIQEEGGLRRGNRCDTEAGLGQGQRHAGRGPSVSVGRQEVL